VEADAVGGEANVVERAVVRVVATGGPRAGASDPTRAPWGEENDGWAS